MQRFRTCRYNLLRGTTVLALKGPKGVERITIFPNVSWNKGKPKTGMYNNTYATHLVSERIRVEYVHRSLCHSS